MFCLTTKNKFEVEDPEVVVLANGRFAYRCECPWEGKNGKKLYAFKFCSTEAYQKWNSKSEAEAERTDTDEETEKREEESEGSVEM